VAKAKKKTAKKASKPKKTRHKRRLTGDRLWGALAAVLLVALFAAAAFLAPAPLQPVHLGEKIAPHLIRPTPLPRKTALLDEPVVAPPPSLPNNAPRVAIVIDDMGGDPRASARAIALPAFVTLSFLPYAKDVQGQADRALTRGHEILLHLPMQPIGHEDPGPGALAVGNDEAENARRLKVFLDSFHGYDGVNNHMGSLFTQRTDLLAPVMQTLKARGLFFLDSRTAPQSQGLAAAHTAGIRALARDVFLDDARDLASIAAMIARLEALARRQGVAVAIGHPHAETLAALERWMPEAEAQGLVFVPLHSLLAPSP
jgi:polysaccharide deacetylase 2 family uncharacterized protein YibQ